MSYFDANQEQTLEPSFVRQEMLEQAVASGMKRLVAAIESKLESN